MTFEPKAMWCVQVETDKATMDMETPGEGYVAKILVEAGIKDLPLGKVRAFHHSILYTPAYLLSCCVGITYSVLASLFPLPPFTYPLLPSRCVS